MLKFAVKKSSKDIFHDAVASKDISRLKFLLQNNRLGFEVDELDEDGLTALQRSCFIGNLKLVQLLVTYGANIHIQDREGWSVLHASAVAGNYSILRYLISMGADVNVRNDLGQLPIDLANDLYSIVVLLEAMEKSGYRELIEQFFAQRPSLKRVISKELRSLSLDNQTSCVVDDNNIAQCDDGENANDNQQLSSVLNGGSLSDKTLNCAKVDGSLETSLSSHNKDIAARLNEEGGKPERARLSRILMDKRTPRRAVCKKCMGKKRSSSASSTSSESSTSSHDSAYISSMSLHTDSQYSQINIENLSDQLAIYCDLSKGNSTKQKTHVCKKKDKNCPKSLYFGVNLPARPKTPPELLVKLKELQNDVNSLNSAGISLLHESASEGDAESVRVLIEKGAEVNRQALNGRTPLHEAAKSGSLDCTMLLLAYGGDLFADDDNGNLPIDLSTYEPVKQLLHRAMAMK